jgi:YcxB-like protein
LVKVSGNVVDNGGVAGESTSITYELKPGEFWRASLYVFFRNPRSYRSLFGTSLVVTIIVGLLIHAQWFDYFALFGLYCLLLLAVLLLGVARVARRSHVTRARTVTIGPEGLTREDSDTRTTVQWSAVRKVYRTQLGYVVSLTQRRGFFLIPKRALPTGSKREALDSSLFGDGRR